MKTPLSLLPDLPTLTDRLSAGLDDAGLERPVKILQRELPKHMSTFPNEIVTCRLPDGRRQRVFIKYGAGRSHPAFGHRAGLAYEAEVYRRVLEPLTNFRPKCLGSHTDPETGDATLLLEYAYRSKRLSDISWKRPRRQAQLMMQTARWLGRFHAEHEPRVQSRSLAFLKRYDAAYYRGWAQRTFKFARPLLGRFPWLTELRKASEAWFAPLESAPRTVIHGEFFSKTVFVRGQNLFLVDWETAAIAPGEIDLATLIDGKGWPATLVRQCEYHYQRARWTEGTPSDFWRVLEAARMYLQFRWLGEWPDRAVREKTLWRYDHLYAAAKRLGFL